MENAVIFDINNGLTGMLRDFILRLCRLLGAEPKKIRNIFVSQKNFFSKYHTSFKSKRKKELEVAVVYPYLVFDSLSISINRNKCYFLEDEGLNTVFLDHSIDHDVFRCRVRVNYDHNPICSGFYLGTAHVDAIKYLFSSPLGSISRSVAFHFWKDEHGILKSHLCGTKDKWLVSANAAVIIEVDANAKTVRFYVGAKRIPLAFSHVSSPLRIGITGEGEGSVSFESFQRLFSSVQCRETCRYFRME